VRYLEDSKLQLFHGFKAAYPGVKMSKSTFYKRVPKHYKEPSKLTDLCNICEAGKRDEAAPVVSTGSSAKNSNGISRDPH